MSFERRGFFTHESNGMHCGYDSDVCRCFTHGAAQALRNSSRKCGNSQKVKRKELLAHKKKKSFLILFARTPAQHPQSHETNCHIDKLLLFRIYYVGVTFALLLVILKEGLSQFETTVKACFKTFRLLLMSARCCPPSVCDGSKGVGVRKLKIEI